MDIRKLMCCILFTPLTVFAAEKYMVLEWNITTRIVLVEKSCLVEGLHGSRAVMLRDDGEFIQGCWKYADNKKHIRIEWNNPLAPGDFSVLPTDKFEIVNAE